MDMQKFETVAQSNFLRMYEAARIREAKEQTIPNAAIAAREVLHKELEARRPAPKEIEAKVLAQVATNAIPAERSTAPANMMEELRRRMGG